MKVPRQSGNYSCLVCLLGSDQQLQPLNKQMMDGFAYNIAAFISNKQLPTLFRAPQ